MAFDAKTLPWLVTVYGVSSRLVHRTFVPGSTVSSLGTNANLAMSTVVAGVVASVGAAARLADIDKAANQASVNSEALRFGRIARKRAGFIDASRCSAIERPIDQGELGSTSHHGKLAGTE